MWIYRKILEYEIWYECKNPPLILELLENGSARQVKTILEFAGSSQELHTQSALALQWLRDFLIQENKVK